MTKIGEPVSLELMTGENVSGILLAFDPHTVVIQSEGREILIYKHAIAAISGGSSSLPPDDPRTDPDDPGPHRGGGAVRILRFPPPVMVQGRRR